MQRLLIKRFNITLLFYLTLLYFLYLQKAVFISQQMNQVGCGVKLGMEFFYTNGPQGVKEIRDILPDLPLFIDLKLHDIPNTVASGYRALFPLQPDYINLHTTGGFSMIKSSVEALKEEADKRNLHVPKVLGVTILTSMNADDLTQIGMTDQPVAASHVLNLAQLAQNAGLDGVVCSGLEIPTLRQNLGSEFVLIVPVIRPAGEAVGDQKRVMTPLESMQAGATHLVIGRPITGAKDPIAAAVNILESLKP